MRAELALLEAALDYRFASPDLLRRALTHSSAAHEAQEHQAIRITSGWNSWEIRFSVF